MPTSFESKVLAAFGASVLVVLGLVLLTWKMAADSADAANRVSRTQAFLEALAQTRSDTLQIEFSTQGFRISGDPARLVERDAAVASRHARLTQLRTLGPNLPQHHDQLARLEAVIAERLAISRRVEELTKTQGSAVATAYAQTAPLQETRERTYRILKEMEADARQRLDSRLARRNSARMQMAFVGSAAAGLLTLLLLATYVLIRRQLQVARAGQRALAESEENLSTTLHSIGDAVLATDLQSRITRINPVAEQLTGWSRAEALGRPIAEVFNIIHEKTRQPAVIPVTDVLATGEITELANHTLLIARDGTERPIADSAAPIRNSSGQILGVVLVFRDVSREYRAEQTIREQNELLEQRVQDRTKQLAESEVRYRTAFKTSPDPLILTQLPDGLYLEINDGFSRTFGWSREEVMGKTSAEFMLWRHPWQRQAFIHRLVEHGGCENLEAEFISSTDTVLTGLVSANTLSIDGQSCALTVIRDITERKRAEEELIRYRDHLQDLVAERTAELAQAKKSAEDASLAKGQFLANMSHEIRTPLNAIAGMSRLIRRQGLLPEQADRLDKLDTAASHLSSTINDILDLSKIEAGKLELLDEALDIASLLANVVDMLQDKAAAKNLRITHEMEGDPANLRGDATRLRQALLNYAGNAIKFTESGQITVRAKVLETSEDSTLIQFEVQDTGVGISAETLGRLFNAFEQADHLTSSKYGGTGLGLSITKRLAEGMGGRVGATSVPGAGSTFWFSARLRKGPPSILAAGETSAEDAEATLRQDFAGRYILLADDDEINREIGQVMLEDVGLVVELAEDGQEAVHLARTRTYDLILMDMQMPRLDGLGATRQIRQTPGGASVPIVAMTANAFSEDRARCLDAGMNDFISKPVEPTVMYRLMLQWMRSRAAPPQ